MKFAAQLIYLLLFSFSTGFAQVKINRVSLQPGLSFNTETTVNLVIEQEFMGIRYNTQMDINTLMFMKVMEVDADTNFILSASYQKMDLRVTSILINMEVSSESLFSGDSLSGVLSMLKGQEFMIVLSSRGEISDIHGLDEMIGRTVGSCTLPEDQKAEFSRNLIQSIGEESIQDNYRNNRFFYPEFPIKAKDQWFFNVNFMKSGIPMELNSQIRLKELSNGVATMVSEGRISNQTLRINTNNPGTADPLYKLSGSEIAEKKIHVKTGLIRESIVSQNVTGSIITNSRETNYLDETIPFKLISRSSVRISGAE